jgi:hypothetical protein
MRAVVLQGMRLLVVATLVFAEARAQSSLSPQADLVAMRIKAAFICKFGSYVEWPQGFDRRDRPFVIGVIGSDLLLAELSRAGNGLAINGRPITVRKLARGDRVDGLDIVYVGHSASAGLSETLAAARGQPILTITESEESSVVGSIINFVVVDDKIRFDIALEPAENSNLKISGRLLAVARKVTGSAS